jgi:hypothetical protein
LQDASVWAGAGTAVNRCRRRLVSAGSGRWTVKRCSKREDEAWRRFAETLRVILAERRDIEGVVPGWTVHDLVWHVGYWAGYAADVIECDRAGEAELEPADSELEEAEILAKRP